MRKRIIGEYGSPRPKVLLILLGAVHGNEPAGVRAMHFMLRMLEVEPITNPDFRFDGAVVGIVGNRRAYELSERYLDTDLNRLWTEDTMVRIKNMPKDALCNEEKEIKELLAVIKKKIRAYKPEVCAILDLHTTSSEGGIFAIPAKTQAATQMALATGAPVIHGLLDIMSGTTLHFFDEARLGCPVINITFEAGQHHDPQSVNRSIACIIRCMRHLEIVRVEDTEHIHDSVLAESAQDLPAQVRLLYTHSIKPEDHFKMLPGFQNFQPIYKGQLLAHQNGEAFRAPQDGLILMPLYQKLGSEGFFIVENIDS